MRLSCALWKALKKLGTGSLIGQYETNLIAFVPLLTRNRTSMLRGPKGEKRPADVIGNAVHIMRIATGEIEERAEKPRNQAAQSLGRKGGQARAEKMTAEQRITIAKRAARKWWAKRCPESVE